MKFCPTERPIGLGNAFDEVIKNGDLVYLMFNVMNRRRRLLLSENAGNDFGMQQNCSRGWEHYLQRTGSLYFMNCNIIHCVRLGCIVRLSYYSLKSHFSSVQIYGESKCTCVSNINEKGRETSGYYQPFLGWLLYTVVIRHNLR